MSQIKHGALWSNLEPFAIGKIAEMTQSSKSNKGLAQNPYAVQLYKAAEQVIKLYAPVYAGLVSALSAASPGDLVWDPAGTITGDISVPAGVSVVGAGVESSIIEGKVTLGNGSSLIGIFADNTGTTGNCYAIVGPSEAGQTATVYMARGRATVTDGVSVGLALGDATVNGFHSQFEGIATGSGSGYGVAMGEGATSGTFNSWELPTAASASASGASYGNIDLPLNQAGDETHYAVVLDTGHITYDFGAVYNLTGISFMGAGDGNTYVEASEDGITWDEIEYKGVAGGENNFYTANYTFTAANYRYLRFRDEAIVMVGGSWQVCWFKLTGSVTGVGSGTANLYWCKLSGTTDDIKSTGGTVNVYACQYDLANVTGTIVSLAGDRAVFDALNYQSLHANDIDEATGIHWTKAELDATYEAIGESVANIFHKQIGLDLTKYGIVLERGASGQWDDELVESPFIFYDQLKHRYAMLYTGYDGTTEQIGLAWSDDLLTWTKDAGNPFFEPNSTGGTPDDGGVTGPVMYQEGGTYYLFYIGLTSAGYEQGTPTICLATSTDMATWTRHGTIIGPSGSGWRSAKVYHPNIVKVGSTYYLFFNAMGSKETIGYATSTDLMTWTVDDANSPVLSDGAGGAWDDVWVGDPFVWNANGFWYMAYYGVNGSYKAQDGLAWTTEDNFPLGWTRHVNNPLLPYGGSGAYDEKHAHKPAIFLKDGVHYHFYTAVDGSDVREIALATEGLPGAGTGHDPVTVSDSSTVDLSIAGQEITANVIPGGIKLDDLGVPDDNTDLNASAAKHGLLPKLSNVATEVLSGVGSWISRFFAFKQLTDVPNSYTGKGGQFLRIKTAEDGIDTAAIAGGGDVLGPAASTDGHLAVWDGTNSKTLKDGGAPGAGGGAPTDAKYVTTAANASLSAEVVVSPRIGAAILPNDNISSMGSGDDFGGTSLDGGWSSLQSTALTSVDASVDNYVSLKNTGNTSAQDRGIKRAFTPAGDFTVACKINGFTMSENYQWAGLFAGASDPSDAAGGKRVGLFIVYNVGWHLKCAKFASGSETSVFDTAGILSTTFPVWLRIRRTGSTIYLEYSQNGVEWTTHGTTTTIDFTVETIGLFEAETTATANLVGVFDYVATTG